MIILNYKITTSILIILIISLVISLFNIFRFIGFLLFPNINIQQSTAHILKYINYEIAFQFISWFCYFLFFIILIYININQTKSIFNKLLFIIVFIFLVFFPIFPVLNLINLLLMAIIDNPPFIKDINKQFPYNELFENNYENIKREFMNYKNNKYIDCFRYNNPLLSNIDTIDKNKDYCWRTLYLKKRGIIDKKLFSEFPNTIKLIDNPQIHNAFFSILDPNVEIKPHIGYYKGYLRYHLGVIIPNEDKMKPYIICGGEKYHWEEGKGVLFDDMYLHYVNNPTSKQRVVLYLDIKRNNLNCITNSLLEFGNFLIENSFIINLFIKNQHIQNSLS